MRTAFHNPRKNHVRPDPERRDIINQIRAIERNLKVQKRRLGRAIRADDDQKIARLSRVVATSDSRLKFLLDQLATIDAMQPERVEPVSRKPQTRSVRKAKVYHVWDKE